MSPTSPRRDRPTRETHYSQPWDFYSAGRRSVPATTPLRDLLKEPPARGLSRSHRNGRGSLRWVTQGEAFRNSE
uniref:Uncharacterized protein n=1 Tax=Strix occidentalis caurina TaxID=311401 RepID=A0A8D0FSK5_STROC